MKISSEFSPGLSHPFYFMRSGLLKKIEQYATQLNGNLLDFGCGSKPYKEIFNHCSTYTGVDFENPGHSHKNESIDYFYNGKELPFANDRFDSIFASEVFEHIFNLSEILAELNRVLKPGGKLLFTCPFVWPEHEKPFDFARYTLFGLQSELEKNGFRVLIKDKSGNFFTAISQMRIIYFHDFMLSKLSMGNRFPFLSVLARKTLIPVANFIGILLAGIFPGNKDLYLSNVVIAEKPIK